MDIDEIIELACKEPTIEEAISLVCTWENERAVKQALKQQRDPNTGQMWETCFLHSIKKVMAAYLAPDVDRFKKFKVWQDDVLSSMETLQNMHEAVHKVEKAMQVSKKYL